MKKISWTTIIFILMLGYVGFKWHTTRPAKNVPLEMHSYTSLTGESINESDLKDKVIFLNYWATWCGPCVKELPSINALHTHYANRSDIIFIIASNENKQTIEKFVRKKQLTLPLHSVNSTGDLAINRIPITYIIDKKGKVRRSATGARNWNSAGTKKLIDQLLAS